jgi:hypothetical protein
VRTRRLQKRSARRGSAIVVVTVLLSTIAAFSLAALAVTNSTNREHVATKDRISAMYVAEAGMAQALYDLATGGTGVMGTEGNPVEWERSEFWVEATNLGGGRTSFEASAIDKGQGYRVEVVVLAGSGNPFIWAAFGDSDLSMDSNALVDSYDSSLGPYAAQAVNGSGMDAYALEDGDIGSNENITLDSNSGVHGEGTPGPTGTATTTGTSFITGSTVPNSEYFPLPPLKIPLVPPSGDLVVSAPKTLPAGSYKFGEFTVGTAQALVIEGPATIIADNMKLEAKSQVIVDSTNGPVDFYVLHDFIMNSNTLFSSTTFDPADVSINLESDNIFDPSVDIDLDLVDFDSNAQLYGTIFAPNASIEINSNFELFGSLVAKTVHLDSRAKVHFDEQLKTGSSSSSAGFTTVMWRGAPFKP